MKIAVPSTGPDGLESEVSMHFGRAPYYTFVEIEKGEIKNVKTIAVPFAEHGPGDLPNFVREHGGEVVIAYGMGHRAVEFFQNMGIAVITGAYGKVSDVVRAFIEQNLQTDSRWKERIEGDDKSYTR